MPVEISEDMADWLRTNTLFTDHCWFWINKVRSNNLLKFRETLMSPARMWFQIAFGPIADELVVLGHCGIPGCVRPDHHHVGSREDSARHALRSWRERTGGRHPNAKVSPEIVVAIREAKARGASYAQLAKASGLSRSGVQHIVRGDYWRDVGGLNVMPENAVADDQATGSRTPQ